MGWVGKIFLVIIVLGALAILADIITWIYEVAWIIPIIIVIVVGFFVWRKSMLRKKMKIKQLVKAALVDGKLSDKEKQTILSKARKLGMDSGEAEIHLEAIIHQIKKKRK
jgi:purine-cytosine permease-like protein